MQFLDSLLIETLLFGDGSLSEEQNAQIFKSVHTIVYSMHQQVVMYKYQLHFITTLREKKIKII
jgi:hypothetical protein